MAGERLHVHATKAVKQSEFDVAVFQAIMVLPDALRPACYELLY